MNTQEASSADTTPVVIEQPPLAVDTQPATLQAQDFAPEPQPADDINPDILPPAEPAESRADALARLVNSNLQSNPPLVDYLTADQLREVFLPIIDFMRAFETASHVPVVYAQAGAPGSAQGLDGDLWVNEDTGDLYAKQQGSWRASTRLRGLDGVTPVKGVDYVDRTSLSAYSDKLKESTIQAATAQVTRAVKNVLATVTTQDGKNLVFTPEPPLTQVLFPRNSSWAVMSGGTVTLKYASAFVITKVTSLNNLTMTITVVSEQVDGERTVYTANFIDMEAITNILVPDFCYAVIEAVAINQDTCLFVLDGYPNIAISVE
jgi:hypothetical protein